MMNRNDRRVRWLTACIAMAMGLVVAACGGSDAADTTTTTASSGGSDTADSGDPFAPRPLDEPYTIRMTTPVRIEVFSQPLLADFFGELEKENITLEVSDTPTSEALVLLNAGDTDVHVGSPVAGFFNAVSQGLDVRWAAAANKFGPDSPTGLYLSPDLFESDGSVDPESLKGAKIALGPSGWGDLAAGFFYDWLEENDLSPDDIEIQSFNAVDALTQLQQGELDGAVLADPVYQQAVEGGFGKLFLSYPEGSMYNGIFVGPNLRDTNREAGEAFFRAVGRTTQTYLQGDYHDDPDVLAALSEVTGAPEDTLTNTEALFFDPTLAVDPSWVDQVQKAWISIGGVLSFDEPIPVDDWVDTSLIEPLSR